MTPALVPQIVWSGLRPLQNALKRNGHRFAPEEVRELIEACDVEAILLEKLWERDSKLLERGAEGRELRRVLKESLAAVDESLRLFSAVRDAAGQHEEFGRLEAIKRRAEQIRDDLAALLRWLDAPPPQIDPAMLTGAGDSPTAEGYESIDDVLARLRAGAEV
jgi:hypothetical protein